MKTHKDQKVGRIRDALQSLPVMDDLYLRMQALNIELVDAYLSDMEHYLLIISARGKGPRHDPSCQPEMLDSYENLMLLCRTHHKMVDDQAATFTTDILRQMKTNHEIWVSKRLTEPEKQHPVKLRRVKQNIPAYLFRLTTGKELLDLLADAIAYSFHHDELKSPEEVDLVGGFLQVAQDWGDLSGELEAGDRVRTAYTLTESLKEIERAGFFVFGGREVQVLEGGVQLVPSAWPVAILWVLRKENEEIIRFEFNETGKDRPTT